MCYNIGMSKSFFMPSSVQLDAIRRKHGLALLLLHGSLVRGKLHSNSDVDIAYLREHPERDLSAVTLLADLSEAFQTDQIDCVDLTHADPLLLYAVVVHSRLLSGDEEAYQTLERRAFHRYHDYQPYLTLERRMVRDTLQSYVTA